MATYRRLATHLTTERLILRPWSVEDVEWNRALLAERGDGTPGFERDHVSTDERGELVWLTRTLT